MTPSWVGQSLDYMRAFAYSDLPASSQPPCVYLATEQGVGRSDFPICYDPLALVWYDLTLYSSRLPVEWSWERPVRFWSEGDQIVYAAKNAGTLNLFRLVCP